MATVLPFPTRPLLTRAALIANLQFQLSVIVASEDLCEEAYVVSGDRWFDKKRREELGHAAWLAADLAALGAPPAYTTHGVAAVVGAQYYYVRHVNPYMLLGYMLALESHPASLHEIDALEASYGPLKCLRHHAAVDAGHAADVEAKIETLTDAALRGAIKYNTACTEQLMLAGLRQRQEAINAQ